ncbi:MAG: sulfatase-like hydrolase/transferase [Bacteroidetes bacterium]|nr:sulfatase-like hydrolase/transferase [Bacteroidota bacterium]MBU1719208.1 sulfatase-like hydrolase/transferase [Bacteroidota bacterium]
MRNIPPYLKLLFRIAVVSLVLMTCFRLILFFLISSIWIDQAEHYTSDILGSFVMGFRFDVVITGYILSIPFVLLGIASFFPLKIRGLTLGVFIYFSVVYASVLLIFCSDIPYFLQFYSRLSTASLLWIDDAGYMVGMIMKEPSFLLFLIAFVALTFFAIWVLFRERKKFHCNLSEIEYAAGISAVLIRVVSFIVVGALLFGGIRGRMSKKSPIRIGTAYFCNDQVLNKLALNPVYSFGISLINDVWGQNTIHLMSEEKALRLSSSYLAIPETDSVSRAVVKLWQEKSDSAMIRNNVVIVIMESMGTYKLGKYGGPKDLTPVLNSIIAQSLYFDNIYTASIHTFAGIYSTLYSFPILLKQQPLEELIDIPHEGIASILGEFGYTTSFFTTHDKEFDNVSGFLQSNGFDRIYSETDYNPNDILSTNGVPDHKMFEFAIPVLNQEWKEGRSFLAAFMTTSNHKPYIIPENIDFEAHSQQIENQITEYADWSMGKFLEQASTQDWYYNTTFVFIADHGVNMGHTYDMPLSFHHTPLIIFSPGVRDVCDTLHNLGGQIDLAPTVLGLLNVPYENKTLGVDLLKFKRPFMYFCEDDKIGCLDNEYYLIIRTDNIETLYQYEHLQPDDYFDLFPEKVDSMKQYAYSMMQAAQAMRKQKLLPEK